MLIAPSNQLPERIAAKIRVTDSCWEWTAALRQPNGYGAVKIKGKMHQAHRVVYEALVGPIPDGLHIDHLCNNKKCVNPEHLEPVTPAENTRRAFSGVCKEGHKIEGDNRTLGRGCRICANQKSLAWYHNTGKERRHSRRP